ncbi:MAG: hypothetical protein SCL54_07055 [Bacillota bacterium]|nr:hypothetical protein [Bacillota bacterium]
MNGMAFLGILMVAYAALVVWIAVKQPPKIWGMAKIKLFIKVLGEKGTVIFFYIFALIFAVVGVWLIVK